MDIKLDNCNFYYPKVIEGNVIKNLQNLFTGKILYGNKSLDNINLKFSTRDKIGLIGLNGSGKTTLLRLISGIYTPESGNIKTVSNIFSLISYNTGLSLEHSGLDNLYRMARYRDIPTNILKENIEILIEFIDIGEFIYEPVRTYSTGMRLRLGISLLKLIKPGFIIMDEGIGAGDRRFVNKAYSLVEEKISQASGILISSHNLSIIDKFTDKTIILDRGAIRFFGDTNEALDIYRSEN